MIKFSNIISESTATSKKFKLGLDVHGVVDSMPQFFAFLTESILKNGGEIHLITGGHWDSKLEDELKSFGIKWTNSFSVYDYLIETNAKTNGEIEFPDGTIQKKFDDKEWDSVKAKYCKDNDISLHLDDTLIYNEYFTTPFARLWSHSNNPKASHKDVRHLD